MQVICIGINYAIEGSGMGRMTLQARFDSHCVSKACRSDLWLDQNPTRWILYSGVKRLGREANHMLPSRAEVNNSFDWASNL
jgi:hypothetical protein